MEHELKIVVGGPNTSNVKVYLDNEQIGFIQDVRFLASVDFSRPVIEITFPDLSAYGATAPSIKLKEVMDKLAAMPNVVVMLKPLR